MANSLSLKSTSLPSAAEAAWLVDAFVARLKSCPFKAGPMPRTIKEAFSESIATAPRVGMAGEASRGSGPVRFKRQARAKVVAMQSPSGVKVEVAHLLRRLFAPWLLPSAMPAQRGCAGGGVWGGKGPLSVTNSTVLRREVCGFCRFILVLCGRLWGLIPPWGT